VGSERVSGEVQQVPADHAMMTEGLRASGAVSKAKERAA
jgi:hypothetical protein